MIQKILGIILIAVAVALPAGALADDASSLLGPASTSSSSALQPANAADGSNLQSSPASNGAAQAPNGNNLQQPASKEQTELFIQGDIDNTPPQNEGLPAWVWVFGSIGALALILGFVAIRLNRTRPAAAPAAADTKQPAPSSSPATPKPTAASAAPVAKKKAAKTKKRKRKTR